MVIGLEAMSYKVTKLQGMAWILLARRALAIAEVRRTKQQSFFTPVDSLLQALEFEIHRLNKHGDFQPAEKQSVPAGEVVKAVKINDEVTDPQTGAALSWSQGQFENLNVKIQPCRGEKGIKFDGEKIGIREDLSKPFRSYQRIRYSK